MASDDKIIDWRSTGRRKARRALFRSEMPYACAGYIDSDGNHHPCGKTTKEVPKELPISVSQFELIWPEENRVLENQLQADHEDKDLTNNDVSNLNWRCSSCHKNQDKKTDKGVSQNVDKIFDMF